MKYVVLLREEELGRLLLQEFKSPGSLTPEQNFQVLASLEALHPDNRAFLVKLFLVKTGR